MNDLDKYVNSWIKNLERFEKTWYCKKCGRFCPNCAGRSCYICCVKGIESPHLWLDPVTKLELPHKDTVFGEEYDVKKAAWHRVCPQIPESPEKDTSPYYEHYNYETPPRWYKEMMTEPICKPMVQPPRPWDDLGYRSHVHLSPYYKPPEEIQRLSAEERYSYAEEIPPISYQLKWPYRSMDPHYVVRY